MYRQTITKEKADWPKMKLKHTEFAHISKQAIRVAYSKYDTNGVRTEWTEEYPNDDSMIQVCSRIEERAVYVAGSIVGLIKKFGRIRLHKQDTPTDHCKALGITSESVTIEFGDHKTYLSDSSYFKDGEKIMSGATISVY